MQGLHRILALPVDVWSEGLLPLQSTHAFRNDFSLRPRKKAKLLLLFFPLGPWIAVIWYAQCLRLYLSCHFHPCPSLTPWRRDSVNQEILPDTKLFRAKTLCGCTQLLPQASRCFNRFSANIPFPVEQTEDSTDCCQPGCIGYR